MITEKSIRQAFDELKNIKKSGELHPLYLEKSGDNVYISEYILDAIPHKQLLKNERLTLIEFAGVIFMAAKNNGIEIKRTTVLDIKLAIKKIEDLDPFNECLTKQDVLEDYLKPIIQANEFIRPQSTDYCIKVICAIINCAFRP